jgi:hypothetical protein
VPYLPADATSIGTHQLWQGTKFHLVIFSGVGMDANSRQVWQALEQAYSDILTCHEVPRNATSTHLYATFGVKAQAYYCIRPDGYIAYRRADLNFVHLQEYLQRDLLGSAQ